MDLGKLNKWLTLGANIGVLLGLIILIIEVRQNAALTRTSMEGQLSAWQSDFEFRVTTSDIAAIQLKSIYTPEQLTLEEIRRLDSLFVNVQLQIDYLTDLEDAGLASRERVETHILNNARFYFGSPYAKAWWKANAVGWEGTRLYEVADPIIQSTDENFLAGYYHGLYTMTRDMGPSAEASN
ncbi:MAG: hypothetical protein AAFW68_00615 [Pseudomonadota bacterium]